MSNYLRLFIFTLVLLLSNGSLRPFSFTFRRALAACLIDGVENVDSPETEVLRLVDTPITDGSGDAEEEIEPPSGNRPESGQTIICADDEDGQGIFNPEANDVTVQVQGPEGGISVTDIPAISLGNNATITVDGPNRPVTTQGDGATAIEVLDGATITISGVVSTSGVEATGIDAGESANITVDGSVSTSGDGSAAVSVGSGSGLGVTDDAKISTTGSDADAVVLSGSGSVLTVESEATVSTEGRNSNAVQANATDSEVTVSGNVSSTGESAAAVLGTARNLVIRVRAGGSVATEATGSNAIEITSTSATIVIEQDGSISVSAGDSKGIVAGTSATVNIEGSVLSAGASGQAVVLGDASELTVAATGTVEVSNGQAVVVDADASSATVTVAQGGKIEAGNGQAIVDEGATDTTVVINGTVASGAAALSLGAGNDTVTVNGSVTSTAAAPAIDLGEGDDTLNDNSSQTISGPSTLATGGAGTDTLNLSNGKINDSANYTSFEVTNVTTNSNPGDPANGQGTTLNVTNDQTGNQINVRIGSQVNVQDGGTIDLSADNGGSGSGEQGGNLSFASGASANVATENITGAQPTQEFTNTTFAEGTNVNTSSNFIRGTASNNETTGRGEIAIQSDFTARLRSENALRFGAALNALSDGLLTPVQQAALDELIAQAPTAEASEALLAELSGEVRAQAASSGVQAANLFHNTLAPSGTRVYTRRSPIRNTAETDDNPLNDTTAIGNGAWISGFGGLLNVDENNQSTSFDANTYGVSAGYDRAINVSESGRAVFGAGVGYGSTNVDGMADSADVTTYSVGTYFEGVKGPLSGTIAASYNSQNLSADTGSDSDGSVFIASAEGFYNLQPNADFAVGPIARLGAAFGSYSGFDNGSEAFGVSYDSADVSQLMAGLGVRISGQSQVDVGLMSLNLDLMYESALSEDTVEFDGMLGESDVSVAAPFANSSGFLIGAEAAMAISDKTSIGVRYQGNLGDNIQSHTGEIKFSILF